MFSEMNTQTHDFSCSPTSMNPVRSYDAEENQYTLELYDGTSYKRSFAPPDAMIGSSSGTNSPRSQGTEWDFGSTDPHSQIGGLGVVWPSQTHAEFTNPPGFMAINSNLASYNLSSHHGPCTPAFVPSPPSNWLWPGFQEEYSLLIPPELSSTCLDSHRSIYMGTATRDWQLGSGSTVSDGKTAGGTSSHSFPLSPVSTSLFPPPSHAPRSSATSPAASLYSGQSQDDDDGDYSSTPGSTQRNQRRQQQHRGSTITRRHTTSHPRKADGFPAASPADKHACHYPSCGLSFARARDLKRHFRLHSGELPYKCGSCDRGFIRSDARARHWRAHPDCVPRL